jgi:hypothetical protein
MNYKILTSHFQILRNVNLGFFSFNNSYGVVSSDLDVALFIVKVAVSKVYPCNDTDKSVSGIIYLTMSKKGSITPFGHTQLRWGVTTVKKLIRDECVLPTANGRGQRHEYTTMIMCTCKGHFKLHR